MNLLGYAVLELDINFIDHTKGPDPHTLRLSKDPSQRIIDPSHTTYKTTNLLIARPLSRSLCMAMSCLFGAKEFTLHVPLMSLI